jgi:hypothetical protein
MIFSKFLHIFTESGQHFEGQEPGEVVHLLLRPHRFTILFPLSWIFLFALIPIFIWMAGIELLNAGGFSGAFWFLTSLYYMALWILLFYNLTLYSLNTVIVTDRRIVQSEQYGFFNRKVSELQAYRVQDISVNIKGMIETVFNFGDIYVQTAGSEREFVFKKIANPEMVKDKIMDSVVSHQSKVGLN